MTTDAELLQAVTRAIRGGSSSSAGHVLAAERAIAAIRASGRLAPEVAGDVKERATKSMDDAWLDAPSNYIRDCWGQIFDAAAPLIAAAAEAKALALVGQCASQVIDARGPPVDHDYRDRHMIEGVELLQEAIESAIRPRSAS